ncbi:MAG: CAP domain-containing protein [Sandaracinus sp.]
MRRTIFAALALASSTFVALGCGPGGRTRLGSEQHDDEIQAPAPSVAAYATAIPAGDPVLGGADSSAVSEGVAAAASARGTTIAGDPRLATLSDWIVDRLGPGGEPPDTTITDFYAWNLGLVEPSPHIIVLGLPNQASIRESVEHSVTNFLERQSYTHWGAAVRARSGLWVIVVTLSWRHTSLEAVPRTLAAGTPIAVRGQLAEGYSTPTFVIQSPSGDVRRLPAGSGRDLDMRIPTTTAGAYRVEILGRGPQGEGVIANFPVYVGQEPPTSLHLSGTGGSSGGEAASAEDVSAELLRLIQEERRQQGLAALEHDPRLDAVALAHSVDMRDHDFVAHTSPTTGTAADRARTAQLQTGLVLENIGRGYSAAEIHRGLLGSPGHRANLINPDVNTVGLGVVIDEEDGRRAYIATQLFLRFAREIDTSAAPAHLLEMMNRARSARGARPLETEPNLQNAAQEAASAYFSDPTLTTQSTVDRASASMRRYAIAFRRIGGVMAVVSDVEEAGQLEPTLTDDVDYVGIGVAQGTRPDSEPNAISVVIMLGWAR